MVEILQPSEMTQAELTSRLYHSYAMQSLLEPGHERDRVLYNGVPLADLAYLGESRAKVRNTEAEAFRNQLAHGILEFLSTGDVHIHYPPPSNERRAKRVNLRTQEYRAAEWLKVCEELWFQSAPMAEALCQQIREKRNT